VNDPDGVNVLSYWQAFEKVRERLRENAALSTTVFTVKALMDDYLSFVEHERKDFVNAKSRINAFILPEFGHREVASITTDEYRSWHRKLATTGARKRSKKNGVIGFKALESDEDKRRRRSSANRILTVFKAALNRAYKDDKLTDAPWRKVDPFQGVESARVRYLEVSEAKRFINACHGDFRRLVQAALATGCRYGELCRLRVADFQPGRGEGKKAVPASMAVWVSKSGQPRHVYLNDEGVALFTQLCAGRAGGELILTNRGQPWKASEPARPMREACERAKITPAIGFHILRHTYGSLALMNKTPLTVVAANFGHADTRMVEKHYGHLAPSYKADAIRAGAPSFGFKPDKKVVNIGSR
jgi:integrase